MAAMSDVPCHFRLVQDARHQLCQVWCLPGTGLEGLELRLAQCLSLDKGGISRLVEAMFFSGTLLLCFRQIFLKPTHCLKEVCEAARFSASD